MIRLIVSDMDGTLLHTHHEIHPENVAALKEAIARGVLFAVASGRSVSSCAEVLARHGIPASYIIAANGCQTVSPDGEVLASHRLDKAAAEETLRIINAHGLEACLCTEDSFVYTSDRLCRLLEGDRAKTSDDDRQLVSELHMQKGAEAFSAALERAPLKVLCIRFPGQEEALLAARRECSLIPGVETTSSWENNFEVMPKSVDKGKAIAALAARLGIAREEVVAFGDNENDMEMLRWAGTGFAMGNAQPHVQAVADGVVAANVDGGVAEGIRKVLG